MKHKPQHNKSFSRPHKPERRSGSHSDAQPVASSQYDYVYGKNPIREILRAGSRKIHEILATSDGAKALEQDRDLIQKVRVPIKVTDIQQLNRLVGPNAVHQNMVAKAEKYAYKDLSDILENVGEKSLILMLDCVQDPQNFGTLCRSALAFGVDAVILPKDRSVAVTPVVCKASSGGVEHLKIVQVTNLVRAMEEFKEVGFWIYGTSLSGEPTPLPKIKPAEKSVVVLGSEGEGLRPLVAKTCDVLIKIPMHADFDSLNVAQAGTVCLYEFATRR